MNLTLSYSLQLHLPASMGPQNGTPADTVLWCPEGPELSVIHKDWKINLFTIRYIRVHTPQPEQNLMLFPGYFQAVKTFFQVVCVKYEQEASHKV